MKALYIDGNLSGIFRRVLVRYKKESGSKVFLYLWAADLGCPRADFSWECAEIAKTSLNDYQIQAAASTKP